MRKKRTCPRQVDLYEVFCAILYLLKNAAVWRALPSGFPPASTARCYFDQWSNVPDDATSSLLEHALKILVATERVNTGRPPLTSFCVVDAQSVKNTDTAKHKGYNAGKKVFGIKRHLAVDTQGLPHAIDITTADVNDRKNALQMLALHADTLSKVSGVLVDGGYTGKEFERRVWQILGG